MTVALLQAIGCALSLLGLETSQVEPDESVIIFPAIGTPAKGGGGWDVEIHGWILEREESSTSRQAIVGLLRGAIGAGDDIAEKERLEKRLGPFLADNERGKVVKLKLCGKSKEMEESEADGHFRGTMALTDEEARREVERPGAADGSVRIEVVLPDGDGRAFRGRAQLVPEEGVSVVSDIDDTIKVSDVLDRKLLLRNTFLKDFKAVDGMARLYQAWAKKGAVFHYVTGSPWQLYEPLDTFLESARFPSGTFHMRSFRLKDSSLFEIFAAPVDHKRRQIDPLIEKFPKRRFILVGDSGEKDPEIYGAVARKFPDSVLAIFIRDVTKEGAKSARIEKAFEGVPGSIWRVFRDSSELSDAESLFTVKSR